MSHGLALATFMFEQVQYSELATFEVSFMPSEPGALDVTVRRYRDGSYDRNSSEIIATLLETGDDDELAAKCSLAGAARILADVRLSISPPSYDDSTDTDDDRPRTPQEAAIDRLEDELGESRR